jgi:hypothetical protein
VTGIRVVLGCDSLAIGYLIRRVFARIGEEPEELFRGCPVPCPGRSVPRSSKVSSYRNDRDGTDASMMTYGSP